ncbi:serine hydrolase [Allosaccharopolyspora coralli]|uniref:Serine hydrolase n=1 Tax=Allosaccharopolyspora coralli TaxID=2665642 RepID=A0A5Q3QCZ0_9PSEU|nr:serine hydrolase domain-containing protein [Allosaccharopolyspora coralli]QGK71216.1 serine hydrolase [Allosaccharopolyspora coralli]
MSGNLLPATERALFRRLAVEQSETRTPSVVAGVVRDSELIWTRGRGRVRGSEPTRNTQYRIGSITKTFVAALVLRLRDEGLIDLADQLDDYVPGTAVGDRSIADLLSHSSGLGAEPPGTWWERVPGVGAQEFVDCVDSDAMRAAPKHGFHYSNTGFGLLGELISRVRRRDWTEALELEILRPLEMTRTTLSPVVPHAEGWAVHPWADVVHPEPAEDAGAMAPAGQLWSTVDDIGRWLRFVMGDSGEVLHPDTVTEMRSPGSVSDGDEWLMGAGLGFQLWRHAGRRIAGHSGSMPGFVAMAMADPNDKTGVVFFANSTAGPRSSLATDLLDILEEHEPRIPEPWTPSLDVPPDWLPLTGQWFWGPTPYVLQILPDGLLDLSPWEGQGRSSRFRPGRDGTWVGLDGYYQGEPLRIGRDPQGEVTHLNLCTFIFTRTPYGRDAPVPGGSLDWMPAREVL